MVVSLLGTLVAFLAKKFKKNDMTKEGTATNVLDRLGIPKNKRHYLISKGVEISHHLGTAYHPFDPKSWSENDEEAFDTLKDLTQTDYNTVKELYNKVFAKGKELPNDLLRLLDSRYYNRLTGILEL